jgi:predicted secreted hydrolase
VELDDTGWTRAEPGYDWRFPQDLWAHPAYRIEWWYLTGNLHAADDPARAFGYQLTLFRVGIAPPEDEVAADPLSASRWTANALVLGHLAVTDVAGGTHHFRSVLHRAGSLLGGFGEHPDPRIAWCVGPPGTEEPWEIRWNGEALDLVARDDAQGFGLRLRTHPRKPRVFQGPGGYSAKTGDGDSASLYTSFTRLHTSGEILLDGVAIPVTGTSWMDQEFSTSQLGRDQSGWDWFGLQLHDGREVMLYRLRTTADEADVTHATVVDADGVARYLDPDAITMIPGDTWTSPSSGATYPVRWRLELRPPGEAAIELEVHPRVVDQENRDPSVTGPSYYEGAVELRTPDGAPVGVGYMELTGYGPDGRPPL